MRKKSTIPQSIVGWREWVGLPSLGVTWIKAKIDTGARSSSLHVSRLRLVPEGEQLIAYFVVHPLQAGDSPEVAASAVVIDQRPVKSSNGQSSVRPVIHTPLRLGDQVWDIELTLTSRDEMGFRMLLGRQTFRRRFLVNAGRSFLQGRPTPATNTKGNE